MIGLQDCLPPFTSLLEWPFSWILKNVFSLTRQCYLAISWPLTSMALHIYCFIKNSCCTCTLQNTMSSHKCTCTSMSIVFCCKLSIRVRASAPGEGRQVNTTVFLGSSAHLTKSSLEKPQVKSATDARTTLGSGTLARSAKLWHKEQCLEKEQVTSQQKNKWLPVCKLECGYSN